MATIELFSHIQPQFAASRMLYFNTNLSNLHGLKKIILGGRGTSKNVENHMRENVGWILFKRLDFTFVS
jgi:hypothetical protein